MTPFQLPADVDDVIRLQSSAFTSIAKDLRDVVIMGTGTMGQVMAQRLRHFPVTIKCFCDNNVKKQGATFLGIPICSVADAIREFNGRAIFVVAIFQGSAGQRQLRESGCEFVVTAATFCRYFGPPLTEIGAIDRPNAIFAERHEVDQCEMIWSDEQSLEEYQRMLKWFLATTPITIEDHDPVSDIYFPPGLWAPRDDEYFVDCGAFDGDSVQLLIQKTGYKFRAATAYEPDPNSFKALQANVARLPLDIQARIRLANAAVGASRGVVQFSVSGTMDSAVGATGNFPVECIALDEDLRDSAPSFIKMDLEGYELEALSGARLLISRNTPILAITLYHKMEHLWQIPLLIKSFRPDYKFYLRRYAEDCWETVCYAVPPGRANYSKKSE